MDSATEMSATISRITRRVRRSPDVREVLSAIRYRVAGTADRKAKSLKWLKIGGPILLVSLGLVLYFALRPVPQPDYKKARLSKIFNYTLLTDEFNRLPVEKRLELIGQLVQRLQGMSAGESMLMASFAAGIAGSARQQIEENGTRLAIDVWDKYAKDYAKVKPEDRGAFLDNAFVEFTKMMESIGGQVRPVSDSDRLAEAKAQAKKDAERFKNSKNQPPPQAFGRAFNFVRDNVGGRASVAQRTRGQQMMRDMARRLRSEDLDTGR